MRPWEYLLMSFALFLLVACGKHSDSSVLVDGDRLTPLVRYLVDVREGRKTKEPTDLSTKEFRADLTYTSDVKNKDLKVALKYQKTERVLVLAYGFPDGTGQVVLGNGDMVQEKYDGRVNFEIGVQLTDHERSMYLELLKRDGQLAIDFLANLLSPLENDVKQIGQKVRPDFIINLDRLNHLQMRGQWFVTNLFSTDGNATEGELKAAFADIIKISE